MQGAPKPLKAEGLFAVFFPQIKRGNTMSSRLEAMLTLAGTAILILLIGAVKTAGIVDGDFANTALGTVIGGGTGYLAKSATIPKAA